MSSPRKVSDSTVRRLSSYLRILRELSSGGTETVSSDRLAELGGLTSAQVRKDLSQFGNFGVRGRGYDVSALAEELTRILGLDREWRTVVVGAGRLGSALTAYPDFSVQGFRILALFDSDPSKHGRRFGEATVLPLEELEEFVRERKVEVAILTTPAAAAQAAADRLVAAGIHGILNFAPTTLDVPDTVHVRVVNLAIELEGLSYAIREDGSRGTGSSGGGPDEE
ncbi:MAG: redox-sensing transcriptional repressor Rex [Gemmatimonadetes bacterium]|nr:redox-sensing transcriptional repressor Rex [Gemmatimonadota bacterium]